MKKSNKRLYLTLACSFGVFIGLILLLLGFIPPRELKEYQRLTSGAGETVQATSTGGVSSTVSGRRGGTQKFCTSWRYELDGNERFFTDRNDCYANREDAATGTTAELIYDPADLSSMFVHSDKTLNTLKGAQNALRAAAVAGALMLVGSVFGLVKLRRAAKTSQTKDVLEKE